MTDAATNVLTYVEELESTGLTRKQEVTIARGSAVMLDKGIDNLVTKTEFCSFAAQTDQRFEHIERRLDRLGALVPEVRLHTWMLALLIAALAFSKLRAWFAY